MRRACGGADQKLEEAAYISLTEENRRSTDVFQLVLQTLLVEAVLAETC
jgi:hypothetical protein